MPTKPTLEEIVALRSKKPSEDPMAGIPVMPMATSATPPPPPVPDTANAIDIDAFRKRAANFPSVPADAATRAQPQSPSQLSSVFGRIKDAVSIPEAQASGLRMGTEQAPEAKIDPKTQKQFAEKLNSTMGLKKGTVKPEDVKSAAQAASGEKTQVEKESQDEDSRAKDELIAQALVSFVPTLLGGMLGGAAAGAKSHELGTAQAKELGKAFEADKDRRAEAQRQKLNLQKEAEERQWKTELEEKKMKHEDIQKEMDRRNHREVEMMKALREQMKSDPRFMDTQQRLSKLSGEQRKRLDDSVSALRGVQGMEASLAAGQKPYNLIGDNDFTRYRREFTESLGRLQSGGAIGKEEQKRFEAMAPTISDPPDMRIKKMAQVKELMAARIRNTGFNESEFPELAPGNFVVDKASGIERMMDFGAARGGTPSAVAAPPMTREEKIQRLQQLTGGR